MLDEGCLGEHSKTIILFACFEGGVGCGLGWGGGVGGEGCLWGKFQKDNYFQNC